MRLGNWRRPIWLPAEASEAHLSRTRVSFRSPSLNPQDQNTPSEIYRLTCWHVLAFLFCAYGRVNGASSATRPKTKKNDGRRSTQDRSRSIRYILADLPRVTSPPDWIGLKRLACSPLRLASGQHPQRRGGRREDLAPCSQPLCKHRHIQQMVVTIYLAANELHHACTNASGRSCHGFETWRAHAPPLPTVSIASDRAEQRCNTETMRTRISTKLRCLFGII